MNAKVSFLKHKDFFKTTIIVNEGTKRPLIMKGDARNTDIYASFNEALEHVSKRLRRYNRKLKH